jgi:hypothetical protein
VSNEPASQKPPRDATVEEIDVIQEYLMITKAIVVQNFRFADFANPASLKTARTYIVSSFGLAILPFGLATWVRQSSDLGSLCDRHVTDL